MGTMAVEIWGFKIPNKMDDDKDGKALSILESYPFDH